MKMQKTESFALSRRQVLILGGAATITAALFGLPVSPAHAAPKDVKAKLNEIAKGAELQKGKITMTLPRLTQDGKRTRIKVEVDSPMTEQDHVKSLHIMAERNTQPGVATYHFGPLSGKAEITTRMRVAKSQTIVAVAEMSDGSVYYAKARCNVARGAGGCG